MRALRLILPTLAALFIIGAAFTTQTTPVDAQGGCGPYTPSACETIPVTPAPSYCLAWDSPEGGIANTGFTMLDPATNAATYNATPLVPSVPSLNPGLINVSGGTLNLSSTQGINFDTAAQTRNNSAVNNLAVAYPNVGDYRMEVDIVNLDFNNAGNNFQQTGLVWGVDENNYVKLVLMNVSGGGGTTARIQFLNETGDNSAVNWAPGTNTYGDTITNLDTKTITLALILDRDAGEITASYAIDGGPEQPIGNGAPTTLAVPAAIMSGTDLGGVVSGAHQIAGLMTSQRNSTTQFTTRFDNFCLTRTDNTPPVAFEDSYSVDEDSTLTVDAAGGLLANDIDNDAGDTISVDLASVTNPAHGILNVQADGAFTYLPATDYSGPDSFSYRAIDSQSALSNTITVSINVIPTNDLPVAQADSYVTDEDVELIVPAPGVLANDSDPDSDPLSAVLVDNVTQGTLTLNTDGSFSYTPAVNFSGTDSFTYSANDGSADSGVVTVDLTINSVNDAPVALDDSFTTGPGVTLTIPAPGVLANDSDVEGDALTATLESYTGSGSVLLNTDGSFSYTSGPGFDGTDSFSYLASDTLGAMSSATVSIKVGTESFALDINGSFEQPGGTRKEPNGWKSKKLLKQDKQVCDKVGRVGKSDKIFARSGECAFRFKFSGVSNFTRRLSTVYNEPLNIAPGSTLDTVAHIDAQDLHPGGEVRVVVKYQDGTKDRFTLDVPTGTYNYTELNRSLALRGDVKKVKVLIMYKGRQGMGGEMTVDDITLTINTPISQLMTGISRPGDGQNGSLLPLPEAPGDFRGSR